MRDFDREFAKFDRDFDKNFNRVAKGVVGLWIVGSLVSLALTIAVIWAIVQLVAHFTG